MADSSWANWGGCTKVPVQRIQCHVSMVTPNQRRAIEKIFRLKMKDGDCFVGTMKELSEKTGISRQTIYDRYYNQRPGRKILSVTMETGQQTIESKPAA